MKRIACLALALTAACSGPRYADSVRFHDLRYGQRRADVVATLDADLFPSLSCFGSGPQGKAWRAEACLTSDTHRTYVLLFADEVLVSVVPLELAEEHWAAQFSPPDIVLPSAASLETLGQALLDQRLDPASADFSRVDEARREDARSSTQEVVFFIAMGAVLVPVSLLIWPIGHAASARTDDNVEAFYAPLESFTGASTPADVVAALGAPQARLAAGPLDVLVYRPLIDSPLPGDVIGAPVSLAFSEGRLFWVIWSFDAERVLEHALKAAGEPASVP